MGEHTAFFYGTLMSPSVLARVLFGDSTLPTTHLTIVPAVLHDYCRYKVAHADYPGIVPKPGTSVRGVYVSGLTSFDRRNLDIFEGAQYQRQKVNVKLVGKQEQKLHDERFGLQDQKSDLFEKAEGYVEGKDLLSAETYVFIEGEDKLEDSEWSFDEFVKEKLYRWADKSEEYADLDNAISDTEDDGHDPIGGSDVRGSETDAKLKGKGKEVVTESQEILAAAA